VAGGAASLDVGQPLGNGRINGGLIYFVEDGRFIIHRRTCH
jgi:hypothetical protein